MPIGDEVEDYLFGGGEAGGCLLEEVGESVVGVLLVEAVFTKEISEGCVYEALDGGYSAVGGSSVVDHPREGQE